MSAQTQEVVGRGGAVAGQDGQEFPTNPEVDEAAGYAVQQLSSQSNSLYPFTLKQVMNAKVDKSPEGVTHHLKLRVGQGTMPDQVFEVEVAASPRAFTMKHTKVVSQAPAEEEAE